MMILALDPTRARTTASAAVLGGLAAGAVAPIVLGAVGPVAAAAALGAAIAATTLVAQRGSRIPQRAVLAGACGLVGAAAEGWIHGGPAVALLGLGIGLALAPEGLLGGVGAALGRASASSVGALVGAIVVGSVGRVEPFASLSASAWGALLGGAIGLGAGLGEALRAGFHVAPAQIPELEAARGKLAAETRPLVESARNSYGRILEAVGRAEEMPATDKLEALATAKELALATVRQALAADELARAVRSVPADAPSSGTTSGRERIETTLGRRRDEARAQASESATALAELALALTARVAPAAPVVEEDLAARARGLASRLNGRDPVPVAGAKG